MVSCPLFPWTTSSAAVADSCHIHSLSPLATSDQVQGVGYSESEVETDATNLELETDAATLKLETYAMLVFLSHRIIRKRTYANCSLHPRVFQGTKSTEK
jgi:hypothetical protein